MAPFVSLIIPNRNGAPTIGKCLETAFASAYAPLEVIVVDDCSQDTSVEIIRKFPCKLVRLEKHSGASRARNVGAQHASGDQLFFTDADCLLREDTLSVAARTLAAAGPNVIVGGTYTALPHDTDLLGAFQSVFVNYSETKNADHPDYIAAHALAVHSATFRKTGGFAEDFLPILEDVEFSHRVRQAGYRLVVNPELMVQHIFNFSLVGSLRNAFRKSMYWTAYSLGNGDLLVDSGAASAELKINVASYGLTALLVLLSALAGTAVWLVPVPLIVGLNLLANRGLLRAFRRARGCRFALAAAGYYVGLYPLAVGAGALAGAARYLGTPGFRRGT